MKKIKLLLLTVAMSAFACFSAFAGEWQQDGSGWWYDNGDATYENNGWSWIDGKCYYFTPEGYCLISTTTPDNYQVDTNGAWIMDGVVQTQDAEPAAQQETQNDSATIQFTAPSNYYFFGQKNNFTLYASYDDLTAIGLYDFDLEIDLSEYGAEGMAYAEEVLNSVVQSEIGEYQSKATCQLNSGTWTRFNYDNGNFLDTPGTMTIYSRFVGQRWHIVLFVGHISGMDTDAIMNASVR